jgi:hypothetical protein
MPLMFDVYSVPRVGPGLGRKPSELLPEDGPSLGSNDAIGH